MTTRTIQFQVGNTDRHVTGLLNCPAHARLIYVMGHGAGAGMRHPFLHSIAERLAAHRIGTLRYQFPYMEAGRKSPDSPATLEATVQGAIDKAMHEAPDLPIIAGGKSLGGRITSMIAAKTPKPPFQGLVFLGYPLHAPNKPGTKRAEHLSRIDVPMLFLQGTRDSLAQLDLLRPIIKRLAPLATMHVVEGGDHSFKVLKRSGRTDEEVMSELVDAIAAWSRDVGLI